MNYFFVIFLEKCKSIELIISDKINNNKQCSIKPNLDSVEIKLYKKLRRLALKSDGFDINESIAKIYYKHALEEINLNGFQNLNKIVSYLNQSSCLDHHMASFVISTFYSHGLGLPFNNQLVKIIDLLV